MADDELKAIWQACEAVGWPFGPIVRLLILTGQRRSEIAEMRWHEIEFDKRVWTLPAARAKNGVEHQVPLSEPALTILKGLPRIAAKAGYIFTTKGEAPVSGFANAKERVDAATLPILHDDEMNPWTLHDLRRTFASGCARLNIDLHVIEKVLNHVSGSFRGIVGVYQRHSFADEKRAALDAWGRFVETLLSGERAGNVVALKLNGNS